MSVTNVKSRWVDGNLVFYDKSDNIICTFDGTNRKVSFPSGSSIELPDEVLAAADIALAEGSLLVGNAAGAAAALDASTDAQILVGDGTTLASVAVSGDITLDNAGVTAIGAGKVTNAMVAPAALDGTVAKVQADANIIGAIPVLHRIDIAAGALAETDVVLTHKTRVTDAWVVLRGAGVANTTLTVQNGATAITDAMDVSGSDKAIIRAATLDDAQHEVAAAGTLKIKTETGASQPDCTVYVLGVRVA